MFQLHWSGLAPPPMKRLPAHRVLSTPRVSLPQCSRPYEQKRLKYSKRSPREEKGATEPYDTIAAASIVGQQSRIINT